MFFAQKIYYNNKPLILTTSKEMVIQAHPEAHDYLSLSGTLSSA